MNISILILLKMLTFNELYNYGMSERYLVMQCEMTRDAYRYCHDLSDSVDLGRMSEQEHPTVLDVHGMMNDK